MKKLITVFALWFALIPMVQAGDANLLGMRMWPAPDSTRVVFDISQPVEYNVFTLENPRRVVIDIRDISLKGELTQPSSKDGITQRVRHGPRGDRGLRIVLDVRHETEIKSLLLGPNQKYGHRLVVDLISPQTPMTPEVTRSAKRKPDTRRDIVIAIDAGHGGEDPGARGYSGIYEKDLVLEIARRLERLIDNEPGMRPVMIRDGDYYLSLRNRTLKARKHEADLFVSIHADAFHDRRVSGTSLYVLSQGGASSEAARWLAERHNASDLIGGVSLDDKDNVLASVLLDLSQSATIDASYLAGEAILKHMGPVGRLHKRSVQQAGFAVLKSPDIPSVLIETAFISNPDDERRLRSPAHQQAIADAIYRGVRDYFYRYPPAGTQYAANRRHVIERGETLSHLAKKYQVSVANLRAANQLPNDVLRVGQEIRIPGPGEG